MQQGSSTKRGATRTLAFLTGATGGPDDVRAFLAGGYLYDGFAPAGYGALPVTATDQITLLTRNIQTTQRVRAIAWIADENPGAIGWTQNVDPRTDGFTTVTVDDGANDSDKTFAVPTDASRRPITVLVDYAATATLGTRTVGLKVRNATPADIWNSDVAEITASQTAVLRWEITHGPRVVEVIAGGAPRRVDAATAPTGAFSQTLPDRLKLTEAFDIRIFDAAAVDAAADDMKVRITWEEFIEP